MNEDLAFSQSGGFNPEAVIDVFRELYGFSTQEQLELIRANLKNTGSTLNHLLTESWRAVTEKRSIQHPKPVVVLNSCLDSTERSLLENCYAGYSLRFTDSNQTTHPFAAASRALETFKLYSRTQIIPGCDYTEVLEKTGKDVLVIDVGGNPFYPIKNNYESVHVCNPCLDNDDRHRITQQTQTITDFARTCFQTQKKATDIQQQRIRDYLTVHGGNSEIHSTKTYCDLETQHCTVKAEFMVCIHSLYNITPEKLADAMIAHDVNITYATVMFVGDMLIQESGVVGKTGMRWEFVREGKKIRFWFDQESSRAYTHDYDNFLVWFSVNSFVRKDSIFNVELEENIGGVQYMKITRSKRPVSNSVESIHRVFCPITRDNFVLNFQLADRETIAKQFDSFWKIFVGSTTSNIQNTHPLLPDPSLSDLFKTCTHTVRDGKDVFSLSFLMPKSLIQEALAYAYGIKNEKFTPNEVFIFLRSKNSTVYVGKEVLRRSVIDHAFKLYLAAHVIYLYAYNTKYVTGKGLQGMKNEIDLSRAIIDGGVFTNVCRAVFNPVKRFFTRISSRTAMWAHNLASNTPIVDFLIEEMADTVEFKTKVTKNGRPCEITLLLPPTYTELFGAENKERYIRRCTLLMGYSPEADLVPPYLIAEDRNKTIVFLDSNIRKFSSGTVYIDTNKEFLHQLIDTVPSLFLQRLRLILERRNGSVLYIALPENACFRSGSLAAAFHNRKIGLRLFHYENQLYFRVCNSKTRISGSKLEEELLDYSGELQNQYINSILDSSQFALNDCTLSSLPMPISMRGERPLCPLPTEVELKQRIDKLAKRLEDYSPEELRNAKLHLWPEATFSVTSDIANRSARKLHELCLLHPELLSGTNYLDLCCNPGGMSLYLTKHTYRAKFFGVSLKGQESALPATLNPPSLLRLDSEDETFDLTEPESLSKLITRSPIAGYDTIIADGAVDSTSSYERQEELCSSLIASEITAALSLLSENGNFLLKTFHISSAAMRKKILALCFCFHEVTFSKPSSSYLLNSERYIFCKGYYPHRFNIASQYLTPESEFYHNSVVKTLENRLYNIDLFYKEQQIRAFTKLYQHFSAPSPDVKRAEPSVAVDQELQPVTVPEELAKDQISNWAPTDKFTGVINNVAFGPFVKPKMTQIFSMNPCDLSPLKRYWAVHTPGDGQCAYWALSHHLLPGPVLHQHIIEALQHIVVGAEVEELHSNTSASTVIYDLIADNLKCTIQHFTYSMGVCSMVSNYDPSSHFTTTVFGQPNHWSSVFVTCQLHDFIIPQLETSEFFTAHPFTLFELLSGFNEEFYLASPNECYHCHLNARIGSDLKRWHLVVDEALLNTQYPLEHQTVAGLHFVRAMRPVPLPRKNKQPLKTVGPKTQNCDNPSDDISISSSARATLLKKAQSSESLSSKIPNVITSSFVEQFNTSVKLRPFRNIVETSTARDSESRSFAEPQNSDVTLPSVSLPLATIPAAVKTTVLESPENTSIKQPHVEFPITDNCEQLSEFISSLVSVPPPSENSFHSCQSSEIIELKTFKEPPPLSSSQSTTASAKEQSQPEVRSQERLSLLPQEISKGFTQYADHPVCFAHCISSDIGSNGHMSAGVAVAFAGRFGKPKFSDLCEELTIQNVRNSFVVGLVTKDKFNSLPTAESYFKAVNALVNFLNTHPQITHLICPPFGTQKDGLSLELFSRAIKILLNNSSVKIVVYIGRSKQNFRLLNGFFSPNMFTTDAVSIRHRDLVYNFRQKGAFGQTFNCMTVEILTEEVACSRGYSTTSSFKTFSSFAKFSEATIQIFDRDSDSVSLVGSGPIRFWFLRINQGYIPLEPVCPFHFKSNFLRSQVSPDNKIFEQVRIDHGVAHFRPGRECYVCEIFREGNTSAGVLSVLSLPEFHQYSPCRAVLHPDGSIAFERTSELVELNCHNIRAWGEKLIQHSLKCSECKNLKSNSSILPINNSPVSVYCKIFAHTYNNCKVQYVSDKKTSYDLVIELNTCENEPILPHIVDDKLIRATFLSDHHTVKAPQLYFVKINSLLVELNKTSGLKVLIVYPTAANITEIVAHLAPDNYYHLFPQGEEGVPLQRRKPDITKQDFIINAIEEIKYIWHLTAHQAENNMRLSTQSSFDSLRRLLIHSKLFTLSTSDTSLGFIDVRQMKWAIKPGALATSYRHAYFLPQNSNKGYFLDFDQVITNRQINHSELQRFKERNPHIDYLAVSKSVKVMNEQNLYNAIKHYQWFDSMFNFDVRFVEGVPGGGKSEYIVSNLNKENDLSDLVFTATNAAAENIRNRLTKACPGISQRTLRQKIRNMDSAVLRLNEYSGILVNTIYIDEASMRHIGQFFVLAAALSAKTLVICGDTAQIAYFNNEGYKTSYHRLNAQQLQATVEYRTNSYRIPADAALALNSIFKNGQKIYQKPVKTYNPIIDSLSGSVISSLHSVTLPQKAQLLTFTQGEKAEVLQTLPTANVSTIAEYQGNEHEEVILIRISSLDKTIYESPEQQVVAISRHTKNFKYYSVKNDSLMKLIHQVKHSPRFTKENLYLERRSGFVYNSARTTQNKFFPRLHEFRQLPDFSVLLRPEYVSSFDREHALLKNITTKHEQIGFVQRKPLLVNKNFYEDLDIEKTQVFTCDDPKNTLQDFADRIMPGSTGLFHENNFDIFENGELHISSHDFKISTADTLTKHYDNMRPALNTPCPIFALPTQKMFMKTYNERNGCVPELEGRVNHLLLADDIISSFISNCVADTDLLQTYTSSPIAVNIDSLTEWFATQPPELLKILEEQVDQHIKFYPLNKYYYMLKRLAKPNLDKNPQNKFGSPQAIAYQDKIINAVYSPMIRDMKHRIYSVLSKNKIIASDMSNEEFEKLLNCRFPPSLLQRFSHSVESDFSKFDKSQGLLALTMDVRFMEMFGMPEEFIAMWLVMHVYTQIANLPQKFKAWVEYQRKSGDPMTFLGNTLFLMSSLSYMIGSDFRDVVGLFAGDDSYLFSQVPLQVDRIVSLSASLFNLEVKILKFSTPYFCSKFLIPVSSTNWLVVPDLWKCVIKLGRTDLVNPEHVEQYRVSLADNMQALRCHQYLSQFALALAERYSLDFCPEYAFVAFDAVVNSKELFSSLYFYDKDDKIDFGRYKLPSLEI